MSLLPITITRLDADTYIVGRVAIRRTADTPWPGTTGWAATPLNDPDGRPLFSEADLEKALETAAGFVTLLSPV